MPFQECRGSGAQIHDHIPDSALDAAYKLHFSVWRMLEVHPAYSTGKRRPRMVDLQDSARTDYVGQAASAVEAGECASRIGVGLGLDDNDAGNGRLDHVQGFTHPQPAAAALSTYWRSCSCVSARPD
ncbi:hypothetical protein D3C72_1826030 [compost metagenome]